MAQGTSGARLITSTVMSKFGAKSIEAQIAEAENLYSTNTDLKDVLYFLANNPKTSPMMLDHISTTRSITVLEAIALNKSTSIKTLRFLSNSDNPQVRVAVSENGNLPFEILSRLSEDPHSDVRFAVAENPLSPKILLEKLIADENPYIASRACTTMEHLEIPFIF